MKNHDKIGCRFTIEQCRQVAQKVKDKIPDIFDKGSGQVTMSFYDATDLLKAIELLIEIAEMEDAS